MGGAIVSRPFVIGLGSHHGDDQAGWLVVRRLRERNYPEALLACLQHPAELLDMIEPGQHLVICDACCGNGDPGAIHCGIWHPANRVQQRSSGLKGSLPRFEEDAAKDLSRKGSHELSLFEVMELGYSLNCLPEFVDIWTVEGEAWVPGTCPSATIHLAAARVADLIWEKSQNA
jgi:hydrogenase maturation protease